MPLVAAISREVTNMECSIHEHLKCPIASAVHRNRWLIAVANAAARPFEMDLTSRKVDRLDVRFWHKTDMPDHPSNVGGKPDISDACSNVCL